MELESTFLIVKEMLRDAWIPKVEEGLSWGTPALKVKKKMLLRVKEPDIIVLSCDLEEKEMLMVSKPEAFFETDHYKGYPALLVRVSAVDPEDLIALTEKEGQRIAGKDATLLFSRMDQETTARLARDLVAESGLPGITEGEGPGFSVGKQALMWVRHPGICALTCALEEKDTLIESNPQMYFLIDHFRGYPGVLVRMEALNREDIALQLEHRWRQLADPELITRFALSVESAE